MRDMSYPESLKFVLDKAHEYHNNKLIAMTISKIRGRIDSVDMSDEDREECEKILREEELKLRGS